MAERLDLSIDEVLTTARNVRKRLDLTRPVERSVVEECIELALQAPNGSNNQGWEWIAVDDPETKRQLADLHRLGLDDNRKVLAADPNEYEQHNLGRNDRIGEIHESVMYLVDHLHEVPVLVVPAMHTPVRLEGLNTFYQASQWGSILQAVWSFMLALGPRPRQRLDDLAALARTGDRRAARPALRHLHPGGTLPGRVHDRHGLQAGPATTRLGGAPLEPVLRDPRRAGATEPAPRRSRRLRACRRRATTRAPTRRSGPRG